MLPDFAKSALTSWKRRGVFRAGERIAVGVSGGADSVALLRLLLELREELGIVLSVVHLNHQLRGRASDADEKFVAKLAAKHGLEFHCEAVQVARKARSEKTNVEDTARRARQQFFAGLIAKGKVDRVAVAHTADDQAETVLAHILRGTGLPGLGGIHPETEYVVRPLLGVRRAELRAYLRTKKQTWREDKTNQDVSRMRARIRKKLLPMLERDFQTEVVGHLSALAEFAREDEEFLECIARERCEALVKRERSSARIVVADLLAPMGKAELDAKFRESAEKNGGQKFEALTKRIVRRLIEERKQGRGQITAQHIGAVLDLAQHGQNGKLLDLPGTEVRRERNELVFRAKPLSDPEGRDNSKTRTRYANGTASGTDERPSGNYEYKIDLSGDAATLQVPEARCVLRLRAIDWLKEREETSKSGAVLDRDRLRAPLILRNWRPGDRLQPAGHRKAQKLKRLLNEKHVSRWERVGWPVLTSGGVLIWARGFPVAAGCAANERTRQAILIAEEMT